MTQPHGTVGETGPTPPGSRRRAGLLFAVAATMMAGVLLAYDHRPAGDGDTTDPPAPLSSAQTVLVPAGRPSTGLPKGISVVTTSTTSSTVPLTATTTIGVTRAEVPA